jgi:hypothetical protein
MRRQCSVHVIFQRHERDALLSLQLFTQNKSKPRGECRFAI